MNNTMFNLDACTRCGLCAEVCPIGIIALMEDKQPALPIAMQRQCVACGHCEAVCPANAVSVTGPTLQEPLSAEMPAQITAEQLGAYFRARRSTRRYTGRPVPRKALESLFDIVRYAPSGVNLQPVRWIVIYDGAEVQRITGMVAQWMVRMMRENNPMADRLNFAALVADWENGNDPICRHAPHLAIAYAPKDNGIAPTDATIALSHLELAAPAFGLGACWAGYFGIALRTTPELSKAAGIPDDSVSLGVMMLGYPEHRFRRIPKRNRIDITWR